MFLVFPNLRYTLLLRLIFELIFIRYGLDLYGGVVRDNREAGVLEPAVSKIKSLKFATEAAITILRIDDLIKLNPENEGKYGNRGGDQCGDYDD